MSDSEEEGQPPRRRQRIMERLDGIAQLPNEADTEENRTQNTPQPTGAASCRLDQQIHHLMALCRRNVNDGNIQDRLNSSFPSLNGRVSRDTTVTIPRVPSARNILRNPEDRRRAADVSVRLTALDKPSYQSTSNINLAQLRRIGLGRKEPENIRIPASTTADEFLELVRTQFPVLRDKDFEVLVGRRGCTMEAIPIPDASHIKELRSCRSTVPIWIRPTSEIAQIPIETATLAAPRMEDPPADPVNLQQIELGDAPPEDREDEPFHLQLDVSGEEIPIETATLAAPQMEDPPADPVNLQQIEHADAPQEDREGEPLHLQLDVSGEENTVPTGYVEAGTPTVLLRTIPRTVLDVTREVALSEVQTEEEVIPEVRTSISERSVTVTTGFREKVKEHASLFIRGDYEDPLAVEVRRNHVFSDAMQFIRVAQEDLHSPLAVRFLGEEGVDLGGLRREFWAIFLHQVTHSSLVAGRPGRLTFRRNYLEQKKSTFFYLGQMAALSVLEDGPGLPIFCDVVANHILKRHVLGVDEGDLPEHIQQLVQEMNQTDNDEDLRRMYMQVMDEANEAGFLVPATRFSKAHIPSLVGAIVENSVHSCRVELEQFQEGLKTHQVLDLLRSEPDDSIGLLSGRRKPVTVAAIRELLHIHYREGNLGDVDRQTAHGFLAFLQATKGSAAAVNGLRLSPKDILMWLTGSAAIPAVGFHKLVDVEFGDSCRVNTCALVVTLTQLPPTVDDVVQYYTELVINSQTFQVQ